MNVLFDNSLFGLPHWVYVFLPLVTMVGVAALARKRQIGIPVLVYFFLLLIPALSPLSAYMMGKELFTLQNRELQSDLALNAFAILLVFLFAAFSLLGVLRPAKFYFPVRLPATRFGHETRILLFLFFLVLFVFFLESGNIITSGYADFKSGGSSPYSSLVNQAFNTMAAILLVDHTTKKKRFVNLFFLILFICFCLVVSRRTLALGLLIVVLSISMPMRGKLRPYVFAGTGFFLLYLVGLVRDLGLVTVLASGDYREKTEYVYYLPGGASNIYMSLLATLDLSTAGKLPSVWEFNPLSWFSRLYEGTFLEEAGYDYNGGFFIVALVYFHAGIVGVAFFGYLLGTLVQKAEAVLVRLHSAGSGGWSASIAIGFLLVLPNLIWYHPIGTIKLFVAITAGYMLFSVFPRKKLNISEAL